ncbi:MAG TPA: hypothetical protein VMM77_09340 [Gemmatimonadaceae bacterium]|nr:hypothetical protein [Gemmatimonadaceae bacterium]
MIPSDIYRIEKTRLAVALRLRGGSVMHGVVFAQAASQNGWPEEVADVLNDADPFCPLLTRGGQTMLIAKEHVLEAMPNEGSQLDDERHATAVAAEVELTLQDGTRRRGSVLIQMPSERPRVLDFLNFGTDRFVSLHASGTATLINRQAIACVRPLD